MASVSQYLMGKAERFYLGRLYPALTCLLICLGQVLSLEHILMPINVLLACRALITCTSIKPLIAILCGFVYSLSRENAFFGSDSSDFFFTSWRVPLFFALVVMAVVSFAVFFYRTRFFRKLTRRRTPHLIPLLLISAAFLLNGVGSHEWVMGNLIYGFLQVVAYLIVFVIFYHGFSDDEDAEDLGDYFAYVGVLISAVLIVEMAVVYATNDVFIDGVINRGNIKFGWGVGNTAGIYLNILVPLGFYATYRSRYNAWAYFTITTLTYVAAIFTISRNALLFGTIIYFLCLFAFCFAGNRKKFFRVCAVLFIGAVAILFALYNEEILTAFKSYVDRGMDDSSRFSIWETAWQRFKDSPIFGNGFRGHLFDSGTTVTFIPIMAHNTVFQLFFSMGLVGFGAYSIYRISTIVPFIRRPSVMKSMLGVLALVLLGESLLDNFAFHIQPVFYYSIAMAIVFRSHEEGRIKAHLDYSGEE